MGSTKHIAIVGMTGVGKSTLLNLLVGSNCAKTSNDAKPCTTERERHDIQKKGITYALWDTRGLNEGKSSVIQKVLPSAESKLKKFLRGTKPKVNLVVFCIHAGKIQVDSQWRNYDEIYAKVCQGNPINIAVVVTQIGSGTPKDWHATCRRRAGGAVAIEGMPEIGKFGDIEDCKRRILRVIFDNS